MYFMVETKEYNMELSRQEGHLTTGPHIHQHVEIVLMNQGSSLSTADDKKALMESGDLYISMPNQVHYYNDREEANDYYLIIISPDYCPEYERLFKGYIPESPVFKHAADCPVLVGAVEFLYLNRNNTNHYVENMKKAYVLILFSEIFRNMKMVKNTAYDYDTVKKILHYCYEYYSEDISLDTAAQALHLSKFYISHVFSDRLQIGFHTYLNSLRIRDACKQLKHGETSVSDIAYSVGYNSIRTFNRCFAQTMGTSPKEYRERQKKE